MFHLICTAPTIKDSTDSVIVRILAKTRETPPKLITYEGKNPERWVSEYFLDWNDHTRVYHPSCATALEFHDLFAKHHHLTQEDQ